jgi:hypothetical protein
VAAVNAVDNSRYASLIVLIVERAFISCPVDS